jgi:hypothetical protein
MQSGDPKPLFLTLARRRTLFLNLDKINRIIQDLFLFAEGDGVWPFSSGERPKEKSNKSCKSCLKKCLDLRCSNMIKYCWVLMNSGG